MLSHTYGTVDNCAAAGKSKQPHLTTFFSLSSGKREHLPY
jgi:hypothetical protein